jgi:hypothetical protein
MYPVAGVVDIYIGEPPSKRMTGLSILNFTKDFLMRLKSLINLLIEETSYALSSTVSFPSN